MIDYSVSIAKVQPVCYNTSTTLTAAVTPKPGTSTPSTGYIYQWETSPDCNTGWTVVPGQTGKTLNPGTHSFRLLPRNRHARINVLLSFMGWAIVPRLNGYITINK
ncbi:MAG TPA: hypothetical protein VM802_24400 [Chitinophaga sp.]|uniref:hypothetical protein n=1 Tax=Chitinophaga sp. TaxID=1869181 RepID=UPI002C71B4DD|nr:hypothetical protein [Chitinophaga sp.]HVI48032.1 hypothetical protein [Chitinophaga sp.]